MKMTEPKTKNYFGIGDIVSKSGKTTTQRNEW